MFKADVASDALAAVRDRYSSRPAPRVGKRAAVIGSGFGGLAVAIRLQSAGFETTLFEANDQAGGRAGVFHEAGFTFDAGPTVITAPHCLEELWSETGRRMSDYVELLPVLPFYRLVWDDGDSFDYSAGDAMLSAIRQRSPGDVEGYMRFVEYSKRVFEKGYLELAATPFLRFSDMLRVAPQLARLRADRSVYATVSRFVKDEHLRQALSFHSLLVGGNPFETSSIYTLIHYLERHWGVFFPRGGTGSLVRALVRLFVELGGELKLSTPVKRVRVLRNGHVQHRVITEQAERDFDLVVSNADLHHTYDKLFPEEPSARRATRKLAGLEWSMSLFVLYFGTNRTYRDQLAHHTVLFGPRYRELLKEVFHGSLLPEDFSLYLHAPTVTDPSLAPAGCDSFYVLSPVPHLGHAALPWSELAAGYSQRILAALESVLPNLRQHVVVQRVCTPETFRDRFGAYHGSAFSCAPTLTQSAWFRPHNRDPHIPGLYLVGAGTHPGAGVPGVVNSAKATASIILEDFPA
jgi:phytoene desaturase